MSMSKIMSSSDQYSNPGISYWRKQPNLFVLIGRLLIKMVPYKEGSPMDERLVYLFNTESKEKVQKKLRKLFDHTLGLRAETEYECFFKIVGEEHRQTEKIVINHDLANTIFDKSMDVVDELCRLYNQSYVEEMVYEKIAKLIMDDMSQKHGVIWSEDVFSEKDQKEVERLNVDVLRLICAGK